MTRPARKRRRRLDSFKAGHSPGRFLVRYILSAPTRAIPMATVHRQKADVFGVIGTLVQNAMIGLGDLGLFAWQMLGWLLRRPCRNTIIPTFYFVRVRIVPVI